MDNNNFNKAYEILLKEVSLTVFGSPFIKKLAENTISEWSNLLSTSLRGIKTNQTIDEYIESNPQAKTKLDSNVIKQVTGPDNRMWNIKYKVILKSGLESIDPPYVLASFKGLGHLDSFMNDYRDNDGKIIKHFKIDDYYNKLIKYKIEYNKNNPVELVLYINPKRNIDSFNKSQRQLNAFALHECSHLFDFLVNKEKNYDQYMKYVEISQKIMNDVPYKHHELNNYFIDNEMNAQMGSVLERLSFIKNNKNISDELKMQDDLIKWLNSCPNWKLISKYISGKQKLKNKVMVKLYHFWNNM